MKNRKLFVIDEHDGFSKNIFCIKYECYKHLSTNRDGRTFIWHLITKRKNVVWYNSNILGTLNDTGHFKTVQSYERLINEKKICSINYW